jgi:hypothetical protein
MKTKGAEKFIKREGIDVDYIKGIKIYSRHPGMNILDLMEEYARENLRMKLNEFSKDLRVMTGAIETELFALLID